MKSFLLAALLVVAWSCPIQAASTVFATVDPMSTRRNPVMAGVGFDATHLSLDLAIGAEDATYGALDLYGVTRSGLVFGVGAVAERLSEGDFTVEESSSEDTVVVRKHDNGRHKGDRHVRNGKVVVLNRSFASKVSILGADYGVMPSLFLGFANESGLFLESRVVFNGDEVSNRITIGARW